MEWDDDGLDDEPGSPLLPPDDRLWRHPSEVAETSPTAVRGAAGAPSSGPPRVVTVVALTSCISVLLTMGVVAVVRPFRVEEGGRAIETPTGALSTVGDVAELTARVRPAIGHVRAVGAAADGGDSVGSGVLIREDGVMLTAHHVVDGATSVMVVLDDGREVAARLVGGDADTDIAVLDLDGGSYPIATLAPVGAEAVGAPAISIGAAGGSIEAGPSVRTMKVSAMGQEAGIDGQMLVGMIRTDAAMAPGCAGGPLVDVEGRVIAIASSNARGADGAAAVGYATPIAVATAVADQLLATGRVVRGWLGIEGASRDGALVHRVRPDSPAAAAGLTSGDVITAVDGVGVASMSALVARLRKLQPGDDVRLSVRRDTTTMELPATLAEKPAAP